MSQQRYDKFDQKISSQLTLYTHLSLHTQLYTKLLLSWNISLQAYKIFHNIARVGIKYMSICIVFKYFFGDLVFVILDLKSEVFVFQYIKKKIYDLSNL